MDEREAGLLEASKDIQSLLWTIEMHVRRLPFGMEFVGRFNKALSAYSTLPTQSNEVKI